MLTGLYAFVTIQLFQYVYHQTIVGSPPEATEAKSSISYSDAVVTGGCPTLRISDLSITG